MEKLIAEYFVADGVFSIAKLIVSFLVLCAIVYALWWLFLFIGLVWLIVWIVQKCRKSAKEVEKREEERKVKKSTVEQPEELTDEDYKFPDISYPLNEYYEQPKKLAGDYKLEDIIFPPNGKHLSK